MGGAFAVRRIVGLLVVLILLMGAHVSRAEMVLTELDGVIQVAAGTDFSLALRSDGTLWSWGSNANGQLGRGVKGTPEIVAGHISTLDSVVAIACGSSHAVAIKSDGTVWVWGSAGIAGDYGIIPVQMAGLTGVVAVSAGANHTLALKSDGRVWAWGKNNRGQLGNGNTTDAWTPVKVGTLTGITKIASGMDHNLALTDTGELWAWGYNSSGQVGNNSLSNALSPVKIIDSGISSIGCGRYHSLAIDSTGALFGWGGNDDGRLGIAGSTHKVPTALSFAVGSQQAAGGVDHTLVLVSGGGVMAFGTNDHRQIGVNSSGVIAPTLIAPVLTSFACGSSHNVGITPLGVVCAWGRNYYGQLGRNLPANNPQYAWEAAPVLYLTEAPVVLTSISVAPNAVVLSPSNSVTLTVTLHYSDGSTAVTSEATFVSSNSNTATVDSDGIIRMGAGAVDGATAIIRCSVGEHTADCTVTVEIPVIRVEAISVSPKSLSLELGDEAVLQAAVLPENATDKAVTWASSDPDVVSVVDGAVTALAEGIAEISVTTTDGGLTAVCHVTVTSPPDNPTVSVQDVSITPAILSLELGAKAELEITVLPEDATNKTVTWSSNEPDIVSVTNGVIRALLVGSADITVTTVDGGYSDVCRVYSYYNPPIEDIQEPSYVPPVNQDNSQRTLSTTLSVGASEDEELTLPDDSATLVLPAGFADGLRIRVEMRAVEPDESALALGSLFEVRVIDEATGLELSEFAEPIFLELELPLALSSEELACYEVRYRSTPDEEWTSVSPEDLEYYEEVNEQGTVVRRFFRVRLNHLTEFGVFLDTVAPLPPVLEPLPVRTTKATVFAQGKVESKATLQIRSGDDEQLVLANDDGTFCVELSITLGDNTISAVAIDRAGNHSEEQVFTIRRVALVLTVPLGDLTLAPLRRVGETAGFVVSWDSAKKSIHLRGKGIEMSILTDTGRYYVNGRMVGSAEVMLKGGRAYVPVELLASLNLEVEMVDNELHIIIP